MENSWIVLQPATRRPFVFFHVPETALFVRVVDLLAHAACQLRKDPGSQASLTIVFLYLPCSVILLFFLLVET